MMMTTKTKTMIIMTLMNMLTMMMMITTMATMMTTKGMMAMKMAMRMKMKMMTMMMLLTRNSHSSLRSSSVDKPCSNQSLSYSLWKKVHQLEKGHRWLWLISAMLKCFNDHETIQLKSVDSGWLATLIDARQYKQGG